MAKGGQFERDICDRLSRWWTGDPDASVFWRTSNSGGRATVRKQKGKKTSHYGDICSTDPSSNVFCDLFTVELKRGYCGISLQDLLDQPKGKRGPKGANYFDWIEKLIKTSEAAGTPYWLLITRRDRREPLVFYPDQLGHDSNSPNLRLWYFGLYKRPIWVMPLSNFLQRIKPKDLRRLAEQVLYKEK